MSNSTCFAPVLVVIDSQVPDLQFLMDAVIGNAPVVVLDVDRDGIQQITEAQQHYRATTLHIVSHGAPGCLYLGDRALDLDSIADYAPALQSWSATEILLYGCNVAAGDAGEEFVEKLHGLTGAAIAASTTLIGHRDRGGNWNLDFHLGDIAAPLGFSPAIQETYAHTLVVEAILTGGGAIARGNFVQVGVRAGGTFGLSASLPVGWTATRPSGSLGFMADSGKDGWATFDGDFFTPGTPEEGFSMKLNGTNYSNNTASSLTQISGSVTGVNNGITVGGVPAAEILWSGSVAGVQVNRTITIAEDGLFILFKTTLTNTSASNINTPIYWMHNVDPDNNQSINGSFQTTNTIVSQPSGSTNLAQVRASQPDGSTLSLVGLNSQTRVSYGGFDNRDAENSWNATGLTGTVGASALADRAIQLSYKVDSLVAGTSTTFYYAYNLAADSSFLLDILAVVNPPDLVATSDTGFSNTDNVTSDTTPTFTGTTLPNSTVTVFAGAVSLGTTTSDASGIWTFTPSTPLTDGTYNITTTTKRGTDPTSPPSTALSVTIDTVPPPPAPAPTGLDLVTSSDLGVSNTDNITRQHTHHHRLCHRQQQGGIV
jgi:Domain of unknown function (DUF4347)/Bacterial Ig-like domain